MKCKKYMYMNRYNTVAVETHIPVTKFQWYLYYIGCHNTLKMLLFFLNVELPL